MQQMTQASFFTEIWKESGNAERMANTLCSFLPFPRVLHVSEHHHESLINVLRGVRRVFQGTDTR